MRFGLMVSLVISICATGGSLKRSAPLSTSNGLGMAGVDPSPKPPALRLPPTIVEVWPGTAPDESGNIGEEVVRMSPKLDHKQVEVTEQTKLITNVTKPTLTIYRPPKDKDTGTAVLICPGGGYWDLYWQLEGEEVAVWLNSIGATGIILKYRVPRRPDEPKGEPARRPLQDAQRAISLVRSKAEDWGIHPQQIGMVGFSAGGHLAIATATSFERRTYEPIDDVDKISCRPDFAIGVYSGYLKAKGKDEIAPGLHIPAGTPPIFLAHGGADIISPPEHSVLMYLALKKAGVPAEMQRPPTTSASARATIHVPHGHRRVPLGCSIRISLSCLRKCTEPKNASISLSLLYLVKGLVQLYE
jgi:acetyl esterase/lipase